MVQKISDDAKTIKSWCNDKSDSERKTLGQDSRIVEKDNIKLKFTEFTDYSQPNKAVADGEVDINAFQHYYFLNNWNKENKQNLVATAETYISPIRLYSGTKNGKK